MPSEARDAAPESERRGLSGLALLAILVGAGAGFVCGLFRMTLDAADAARTALLGWTGGSGMLGLAIAVAACGAATGLAAWLVRRFAPEASGSGIPHVEAVLEGRTPPAPPALLPVKFAGGALAIGAGLALGREGPSVQMGASIAHMVGRLFRRDAADRRALIAGGAGAGLATAFNAPIGGAVFVLEELVGRFEPRMAIVALGASAAAIATARLMLGDAPDLPAPALAAPSPLHGPVFLLLGIVAGFAAALHNRSLLATLAAVDGIRLPVELRAAAVGGAAGAIGWVAPAVVGGGEAIAATALTGEGTLAGLVGLFLLRLGFGAASYAAGTPGGLFAPLIALGATMGLLFGQGAEALLPDYGLDPRGCALVGIAALFAAVVRAPVTGVVLVTEMTGNVDLLLPMLIACFAAMLTAERIGEKPIYEALRDRVEAADPMPRGRRGAN